MAEQPKLTELPRALKEAYGTTPNYRTVYEAARSALIPASCAENGRWTYDPADLPAIADGLGLSRAIAA